MDAGAGTGRITLELAKMSFKCVPLDFSKNMILTLWRKAKEMKVADIVYPVVGDMEYWPFRNMAFDGVISLYALNHLPKY